MRVQFSPTVTRRWRQCQRVGMLYGQRSRSNFVLRRAPQPVPIRYIDGRRAASADRRFIQRSRRRLVFSAGQCTVPQGRLHDAMVRSARNSRSTSAPTSPDLDPIENVWSMIDRELAKVKIGSVAQLKEEIKRIWYEISDKTWVDLSKSVSGRVITILRQKGRSCSQY